MITDLESRQGECGQLRFLARGQGHRDLPFQSFNQASDESRRKLIVVLSGFQRPNRDVDVLFRNGGNVE